MLDVRPTAYVAPLDEQEIGPLTPIIHVENLADENATITGTVRIYRKSLGTLLYTSVLHPGSLTHGTYADFSAETPFNPGAIADDDYFILAEIVARSTLTGNSETVQLGQFYFDIKTAPMGPVPATHGTTHEDGGMDEIDLTGLSGILGDLQPVDAHATSHQKGESDALEIANLGTSEADDTLVLAPDGAGGVEFRAESAGGVTDHGALTGLADDDHLQYKLRHEVFLETDFTTYWAPANVALPWYGEARNSGTASILTGTNVRPGIWRMLSSTSANSGWRTLLGIPSFLLLAGGEVSCLWFRPQTLAGTTRHHGFGDSESVSDPVDGAWIWQDPADGKIWGRTRSNSVGSTTGTGYQLVTNTWYLERIVVNSDATRIDFYLYDDAGNLLWTDNLTTNIPTAAGRELGHGVVATNSGTTAVALIDLDYLSILIPDRRPEV